MSLPHDMTKLTAEQVAWCVAYHSALPLAEIRRRQEFNLRRTATKLVRQGIDVGISPLDTFRLQR